MGNRKSGRPAICAACGDPFLSYRSTVRFCSRRCAGRSTRSGRTLAGAANPKFNGGLCVRRDGRCVINCRDGSLMYFYRGVMAAHVGRLLTAAEIVHHENEDPTDDRLENLRVVTRAEHVRLHRAALLGARGIAA